MRQPSRSPRQPFFVAELVAERHILAPELLDLLPVSLAIGEKACSHESSAPERRRRGSASLERGLERSAPLAPQAARPEEPPEGDRETQLEPCVTCRVGVLERGPKVCVVVVGNPATILRRVTRVRL